MCVCKPLSHSGSPFPVCHGDHNILGVILLNHRLTEGLQPCKLEEVSMNINSLPTAGPLHTDTLRGIKLFSPSSDLPRPLSPPPGDVTSGCQLWVTRPPSWSACFCAGWEGAGPDLGLPPAPLCLWYPPHPPPGLPGQVPRQVRRVCLSRVCGSHSPSV